MLWTAQPNLVHPFQRGITMANTIETQLMESRSGNTPNAASLTLHALNWLRKPQNITLHF